jgi:ribosome-binding ATPase
MKDVGIVGLPQSGKTTLFNALTRAGAPAGGAAGKASVAAVPVPDPRVDVLAELERSRKRVFVQARFVDVAGLSAAGRVRGGRAGPTGGSGSGGLAAQGLGALREADALAMVLAAWDGGGPDPAEAAAELTLELTVADLESIAGGADKAAKKAKSGVRDAALEASVLSRARDLLDQGTPLRAADWEPEEARVLRNFAPLTLKPALAVVNLAEADAAKAAERAAEAEAKLGLPTVAVAAALEAEAAELPPDDAADLLAGYGIERGGLDQVVGAAWRLLDLLTFLTTGEDETRAWEVRRGATAPEAAGRIHSDLQRGFIRAEVIPYDDVVAAGGWDAARSQGRLRTESRSYVVQEGDVLHVRFNV